MRACGVHVGCVFAAMLLFTAPASAQGGKGREHRMRALWFPLIENRLSLDVRSTSDPLTRLRGTSWLHDGSVTAGATPTAYTRALHGGAADAGDSPFLTRRALAAMPVSTSRDLMILLLDEVERVRPYVGHIPGLAPPPADGPALRDRSARGPMLVFHIPVDLGLDAW